MSAFIFAVSLTDDPLVADRRHACAAPYLSGERDRRKICSQTFGGNIQPVKLLSREVYLLGWGTLLSIWACLAVRTGSRSRLLLQGQTPTRAVWSGSIAITKN